MSAITKYPEDVAITSNTIVAKTNESDLRRIYSACYVGYSVRLGTGCCSAWLLDLRQQPVASLPLQHECPRVPPTILGELFMKSDGLRLCAGRTSDSPAFSVSVFHELCTGVIRPARVNPSVNVN
jgi:hypothetical protein